MVPLTGRWREGTTAPVWFGLDSCRFAWSKYSCAAQRHPRAYELASRMWEPNGCTLPRLRAAADELVHLLGVGSRPTLLWIGDSVLRQFWLAALCATERDLNASSPAPAWDSEWAHRINAARRTAGLAALQADGKVNCLFENRVGLGGCVEAGPHSQFGSACFGLRGGGQLCHDREMMWARRDNHAISEASLRHAALGVRLDRAIVVTSIAIHVALNSNRSSNLAWFDAEVEAMRRRIIRWVVEHRALVVYREASPQHFSCASVRSEAVDACEGHDEAPGAFFSSAEGGGGSPAELTRIKHALATDAAARDAALARSRAESARRAALPCQAELHPATPPPFTVLERQRLLPLTRLHPSAVRYIPTWEMVRDQGGAHPGRSDCTHWCQPGMPEEWTRMLAVAVRSLLAPHET